MSSKNNLDMMNKRAMRQKFNQEDWRIIRQFSISIGLAILAVIVVILLV